MLVLKKSFGFYLAIPCCYNTRETIVGNSLLYEFLYDKDSKYHYKKFNLVYSVREYYKLTEWVMRGLLISGELFNSSNKWHYIQSEHMTNKNVLCSKLLTLGPKVKQFENLLYGKSDAYLHNVPLECLAQFYPHFSLGYFIKELLPYCEVVNNDDFHLNTTSLISDVYCEKILKRLLNENCLYLEDIYDNPQLLQGLISQLKKQELDYTFRHFIEYYKNKFTE